MQGPSTSRVAVSCPFFHLPFCLPLPRWPGVMMASVACEKSPFRDCCMSWGRCTASMGPGRLGDGRVQRRGLDASEVGCAVGSPHAANRACNDPPAAVGLALFSGREVALGAFCWQEFVRALSQVFHVNCSPHLRNGCVTLQHHHTRQDHPAGSPTPSTRQSSSICQNADPVYP